MMIIIINIPHFWQTSTAPKPITAQLDLGISGDSKVSSAQAAAAWLKNAESEVHTSDAHSKAVQAAAVNNSNKPLLFFFLHYC